MTTASQNHRVFCGFEIVSQHAIASSVGLRALVVDDQEDVVDLLCELLEQEGLECRGATSGSDALRVAEEFQPHVIFLDVGLPDVSGYDVTRRLRASGSTAYIVALSGWIRDHDVDQAVRSGFDRHLAKPTNRSLLRSAVEATRERELSARVAPHRIHDTVA